MIPRLARSIELITLQDGRRHSQVDVALGVQHEQASVETTAVAARQHATPGAKMVKAGRLA
jgi:hypothetical protein